jgi:hypothetical protein
MDMQTQQQSNWCWAAVAVSLHNFLNPNKASWTQGSLATPVLVEEKEIKSGVDCTSTPGLCNIPAALNDALDQTGNLREYLGNTRLTYDSIKNWVNANLPLGLRIVWPGTGAHFIVIDGFVERTTGEQLVHVEDPITGASVWHYQELFVNYAGQGGVWTDTYTVKKSNSGPPPAGIP